jgi:hypothetical protein
MSTEQNQPEPQGAPEYSGPSAGPSTEGNEGGQNGAGQSRFRRRRRRKKTGGAQAAGANGVQAIAASGEGAPAAAAAPDNQASAADVQQAPRSQSNQSNQQNQSGQPGGTAPGESRRRRKKKGGKKFFQAGTGGQATHQPGNRVQTHQPGNTFGGGGQNFGNGNGGGRRQKKGRGGRAFVGPMDHSYRAVNGNYAENPPSTIQVNGNNGGGRGYNRNAHMHDSGHQSQFLPTYYEPKAPVIAEDAPVKVYCFIDDLFVTAKITEAARKMGVKIAFVKGEKDDIARITDEPEETRAHLILFDLNNVNAKPMTVIPKIRTRMKKSVSIIGFLSHLQGDLKAKAVEAGCDSVMPRSAFSQALPNLLRRYGLEEDLEAQDSQHAYF